MGNVAFVVFVTVLAVSSALHAGLGVRKSSKLTREYKSRLQRHAFDQVGALHYSALSAPELKEINGGPLTWSKGYPSSGQIAKLSRPEKMAYLARARLLKRLTPLAGPVAAVVIPVLLSQFGDGAYRWLEEHLPIQWAQVIAAIGLIYAVLAIPAVLVLGITVEARAARRVDVLEASLRSTKRGRPRP